MDSKTRAIFRKIMREIGKKGGKIGGKRSLETMTPEERSARAKKASEAAARKRTADRLTRERAKKSANRPKHWRDPPSEGYRPLLDLIRSSKSRRHRENFPKIFPGCGEPSARTVPKPLFA